MTETPRCYSNKGVKAEFDDTDIDTNILARILARNRASVSVSWNEAFRPFQTGNFFLFEQPKSSKISRNFRSKIKHFYVAKHNLESDLFRNWAVLAKFSCERDFQK